MGKYRYDRTPPVEGARNNTIEFDSSPRYSITKQYGLADQDFELRETSRNDVRVTYDVYARTRDGGTAEDPTYGPLTLRGTLREHTTEELMRRFG